MRSKRSSLALGVFVGTISGAFVVLAACSDDARPPYPDGEGGLLPFDSATPISDGATGDADGDSEASAPLPESCSDGARNENETDVDCGGNVCSKCIDGKRCVAPTDCAGGTCTNGLCATKDCNNNVTDGNETDKDCGGDVCAKCTIGSRCKQGTDCVSGSCTGSSCACPVGMVVVSRTNGKAYCIDQTEVTKAQYFKFLESPWNEATDQVAACAPPVNSTFQPKGAWPPATSPPKNLSGNLGHAFNLSLPVHYVNWCDAHAYCRWAGKQLCGNVEGADVAFDKFNDATQDAWFNACSGEGTLTFPYGSNFIATKCNGAIYSPDGGAYDGEENGPGGPVASQRNGYGFTDNGDYGIHQVNNGDVDGKYTAVEFRGCMGGSNFLYHMSGNVAEWEDSCDGSGNCRIRGGSFAAANDPDKLRCGADRVLPRVPSDPELLADVGFRCCQY